MKNWRRYEILLPLNFNDGRPVPAALLTKTIFEVEQKFRAVSCETQLIQGRWRSDAGRFTDKLMRIYVDAEGTEEVQEFFKQFKEQLKSRFGQLEIWITSHSIEVL